MSSTVAKKDKPEWVCHVRGSDVTLDPPPTQKLETGDIVVMRIGEERSEYSLALTRRIENRLQIVAFSFSADTADGILRALRYLLGEKSDVRH